MQPSKLHHLLRANQSTSRGFAQGSHIKFSENASIPYQSDCQNCQTRKYMGTELMMCQMDITHCTWAIPYKNELFFCKHPAAAQFNNHLIKP